MSIRQIIPNFITCLNLFCGCLAVLAIIDENLSLASYLVFAAAGFDFLDGFVARLVKGTSEIGKQLDSLADMVSFGFVPGLMMYYLMFYSGLGCSTYSACLIGFIITIFSALRLGKFNIDTRQTDSFIGLPTPANTLLICSFPLIIDQSPQFEGLILNSWFLIILTLLSSYLLISEIHLLGFKFKSFSWRENKLRYILLGSFVILLGSLGYAGIPISIFLYILISVFNHYSKKNKA